MRHPHIEPCHGTVTVRVVARAEFYNNDPLITAYIKANYRDVDVDSMTFDEKIKFLDNQICSVHDYPYHYHANPDACTCSEERIKIRERRKNR